MGKALVALAIGTTVGSAVVLAVLLAITAGQARTTGLADDQRPWLVLGLAPATLVMVGLLVLVVTGWLAGTAGLPGWARKAGWPGGDLPPLLELASRSGPMRAARIALGALALGLPVVVLGAPIQGALVGWLLNGQGLLTLLEAAIVITEIVAVLSWSLYVISRALLGGRARQT